MISTMLRKRIKPQLQANDTHGRSAYGILLLYVLIGVFWALCSHVLLDHRLLHPEIWLRLQSLSWLAFLLMSASVLLLFLRRLGQSHAETLAQDKMQRAQLSMLGQLRARIIDNAHVWINVLDESGKVTVWNQAAERISGYSRDEVIGRDEIWDWLYPDPDYCAEIYLRAQAVLLRGQNAEDFESRIRSKDGSIKIISWNAGRIYDEQDKAKGMVAIGRDVTEYKAVEEALLKSERQLAALMANLPGMAYRCLDDAEWTMQFVSQGCWRLTGYDPEDFIENRLLSFGTIIYAEDRERVAAKVASALVKSCSFAVEYRIRHKAGHIVWVWEQGQVIDDDNTTLLEGIIIDISERKRMEQTLAQMASRDSLTGLYNRRELERQFDNELISAHRHQRNVGLLWLDVDHFKLVNDRFGHLAGDAVLRQLAELLQCQIRAADYVARYGGEELVIVLPETNLREAFLLAERICVAVAATPISVPEHQPITVTLSIGVAVFPEHGSDIRQLFKRADQAMYQAKQQGRNQVCLANAASPNGLLASELTR